MASSVSSNTRPELPAMSKSDADLKRYLETTNATPTCSTQLQQPSFHPDNAHLPAFTLYGLQHTATQSPPLPDKPASIYDSQHNYDSHRMDIKQEPAAASTWNQPQPVLYASSPTLPHHVPVINNQGHYNSEVVLLPRHAPQNGAADVSISYVTFPPYGIDAFDKHPPTTVAQDEVRFPLYEEGRAPVSYLDTTNPSSTPSSIRAGLDTPPPSSLSHESSTPASVFSTISVSPPGQRVLTPPVAPDAPHSSLAMDEAVLKDSDMTDCSPFLFGTSEHMPSQEYGLNTLDHPADSIMYQYSSDFGIGDHFSGMSYEYQQFDSSTAFADNESEVPFPASGSILDPPHADTEPPRHTGRGRGRGRGRGGRRGSARKSQAGDDASDKLRKKRSQQHVGTSHHDDHYALSDRDSKRPRTQSDAVPRLTPYRLRASSLTNQSTSNGFHHVADPSDDDDSDGPDAREGGDEAGGDSDYEDPEDDSDPEEDDEQIDDDGDDEYIQGRSSARSRPRGSLNRKGRKGRAKSHLSAAWALKTVQAESDEPTVSSQILEYTDDMDVDAPSMYQRNGKTRRKRTSMIPLPVPVPNLTKKSRGRKVPQEPLDGTEDMVGESSSSGYVCSGEGSGQRSSRGRRVPTITDGPGLEDRPFVCEVDGCGKRFVRGEHLKRHVRSIHTHDKPFICPYKGCGKTFSRRDNLGQHARVHVS